MDHKTMGNRSCDALPFGMAHSPEYRGGVPFLRLLRRALPSRRYLKTYAWVLLNFPLMLIMLSYLFGRYLGTPAAITGGIGFVMLYVFLAVLLEGVLLNLIDREPQG